MALSYETEPTNYKEASKDPRWMQLELNSLNHNHTWDLLDLPPNASPIGSKWVFKIKRHADGSVERFKARLWHKLDVNNAFLHGDLHEAIYMKLPHGVLSSKVGQVCKLNKSLYGLKQASRQWFEKLTTFLQSQGFIHAHADHTLLTKIDSSSFTAILMYVDDIILAETSLSMINTLKKALDNTFHIKDLGQLKFFLGLEVARSTKGITLCQRKYCLELLHDAGLAGCKPVSTPLDASSRLHQDDGSSFSDVTAYRRLVGRHLFLTTTRPDIAFATQQLSQFMSAPTESHYKVALRVLCYLKQSPARGIFLSQALDLQLSGFSDADWGGCVDTRRSISGYCFFIGQSLVSWKAKKQLTVSCYSVEEEYRSLASATRELQ
ncbi:uncharacterized mitochondrial protein AtMg00810-like [Vicia villosa]|uniref:uncharacterized mitochondrial protein AtMg00810-like n=1 Tax=Vicia villosa TaxID=3911 RepID=UPI00273BA12C|nr:uncharacterized mitochondrial protein AtMg00810-like [Vicia villosa]